ncbi:Protein LEAD-SENSITIVE 1 [Cardamine amara subsp. amara]|uniref:Protein LEAD-SENSITIVE 1 n=1 Tax=Cardamine amara subsp. amara TaxID=228776 RepID=A0ABD1BXA9_CARAN
MEIISRDELKAGDHIYSWRKAKIYSHHGIYIGDEKVIHYTGGVVKKTGTRTLLDNFTSHSVMNQKTCPKCGDQLKIDGVISSCLDCFLAGRKMYLFQYKVSPSVFIGQSRPGTCTTAPSDPCDEVIYRAKFLLLHNGFGAYHALENNCEDFAKYCKTSLLVGKHDVHGRGGQATSLSVVGFVSHVFMPKVSKAVHLAADIGVREDAEKVSVEDLVARSKEA